MTTEQQIEQEIQDKGLTAARLTPALIDAAIVAEYYFTAEDGVQGVMMANPDRPSHFYERSLCLLTFCVLVLRNGFTVTGESACASPANFDAAIGRQIARDNARDKIWALEGYLLKERLFQGEVK